MKLRLSRRATSDLHEIIDYLNMHNPGAAKRVRAALDAALSILTSFPALGVVQQRDVRKYIMPRFPYLIYYSVAEREQEIRIVTIRHAARRPFLTP
jgi:plasmid stabilization system protein ParE